MSGRSRRRRLRLIDAVSIKWPAPAKLNLFLHICGRREDGYHELQTLFQLIDLHDELVIEPRNDGLVHRAFGPVDVPAEQDLVVRAGRLLQSVAGIDKGANITLHKQVPTGAGLGGGSSDAATTLLVLNQMWGCNYSLDRLAQLGLELGADVPLFVRGHTAFAVGVGEDLKPVELGERHYLLVMMPMHISTAELFQHAALQRDCPKISQAKALAGEGFNAFEPLVRQLYPGMAQALDQLQQFGTPRMTGTGSSIFLEMADADAATKATIQLKSLYNVRAVRGQDQSPVHQMLQEVSWNGHGWQSAGTSPSW
ncbi:MAG TPA: 4-(cytidine 5'-diphospho)-2-C-methyl-D-erythritol kinase [Xanthomonadales bacterium]|nr:4-(cytidine 5'-diphospho)-2-C-methyl-D-erythritol kinase [Xanthomonadales bacterium]